MRGLVAAFLGAALCVWPLPGGGSRSLAPARPLPTPAVDEELAGRAKSDAPIREEGAALPAAWQPSFPRFLRPLPGEVRAPERHEGDRRELLFTFDDGPDLAGTPLILEALERRNVKAIFFVNGAQLSGGRPEDLARRELVRKIAARGHLVANHTISHQNLCARQELIDFEIDGNAELIAAATGVRPVLFRAPYGARCRRLDRALAARDLLQVGWNLDPQEWRGGDEDAVFAYVTSRLRHFRGRAILLLHDRQPGAVRALPRLLAWLEQENLRALRDREPAFEIRDYTVFLPAPRAAPTTDFEPLLRGVGAAFAGLERAAGLAR